MSKLTIVAHIRAKADAVDLVKAELLKLIDTTTSFLCVDPYVNSTKRIET